MCVCVRVVYVTPAKNGNYCLKCRQANTIHFDLKCAAEKQTHKSRVRILFTKTSTFSLHLSPAVHTRNVFSFIMNAVAVVAHFLFGIFAKMFSFLLPRNLFVCSLGTFQ